MKFKKRNVMTPKEELFKTMDRIDKLKQIIPRLLTLDEDNELRHLEVLKMHQWSQWKDPS